MQTALVWGLCQIMAKQANVVVLNFAMEKDTKNTIRFAEQVADELDVQKVGNIYVNKSALKELGWQRGNTLKVSIELGK